MGGIAKVQRTDAIQAECTRLGGCREDGSEGEGEQSNRELRAFFSLIGCPNNSLSRK